MSESLIYSIILGGFVLLSFTLGLVLGFKLRNNEKPTLDNPIEKHKEAKEQKISKEIRDKKLAAEEVLLKNIDNYDGTSLGQQDIPR